MAAFDRRRWLAATAAGLAWPSRGQSSAFARRPITLVVPFAPGGIADLSARIVAQAMGGSLGQPFVVDNKPSAGSIVASQQVAHAPADGHTLLLMSNSHAVSVSMFKRLPYDALKDFAPIGLLARFDLGFFVGASSRFASLQAWLGQARAQPGRLTIGTVAVGSTQHLAAELFKARASIEALIVPYKATPALLGALQGGDVDMVIEILGPWLSQVEGKVLRALAVSGTLRHPALPEVPTAQEAGVPRYDASSWNALAAPAATPPEAIEQLNRALNAALRDAGVLRQLQALGVRPAGGTPQQMRDWLTQEIRHWAEVIRSAKIEPQ